MAIVSGANERENPSSGGIWDNLGSNRPSSSIQPTVLGPVRRVSNLRMLERFFVLLSTVALVACLAVTIERVVTLGIIHNCEVNKVDVTLAIVLLVNTLFCLLYVFRGIFGERPFELVALTCAFFIVFLYCIENFVLVPNIFKLVRLVIIGAASVVVMPLSLYFARRYYRSGALIYRTLGSANARLQTLLRQRFACESLLTFDLQMAISMVILILRSHDREGSQGSCTPFSSMAYRIMPVTNYSLPSTAGLSVAVDPHFTMAPANPIQLHTHELIVLVLGAVVSVAWTIMGIITLRYENKRLSVLFFLLAPIEPAYVVFKLVDAYYTARSTIDWTILVVAVTGFGTLSLINRLFLLVQYTICYRNFHLGLRERFDDQRRTGFDNSNVRERNRSTNSIISGASSIRPHSSSVVEEGTDNFSAAANICDVFGAAHEEHHPISTNNIAEVGWVSGDSTTGLLAPDDATDRGGGDSFLFTGGTGGQRRAAAGKNPFLTNTGSSINRDGNGDDD